MSNHFCHSDFGVRTDSGSKHFGRRYICMGTPGTGFFEQDSESRTYHQFVQSHPAAMPPSYLRMLTGREPDYDQELHRATAALHMVTDGRKRELMECYINALTIGKRAENIQRVMVGVKRKIKHNRDRFYVSVMGHYKQKLDQLEREIDSVEYHVERNNEPQVIEAYREVCNTFDAMLRRCRRIWHYNPKSRDHFVQVFFDMGVFDFIRSDSYSPLMRDSSGRKLFLLPDCLIVARSSVDFDILPLKELTLVWQEMAVDEPTEMFANYLVDAACMIQIPALDTVFYFNHSRVVVDFVKSLDRLKAVLN